MSKPAMWKTPPRREYKPKAMDPGEVVVWTVRIDAHWTVPPRYDSEAGTFTEGIGWVETVEYERIGTVWSQATSASSWWVTPDDDDPEPVVVRRAGKSHRMEWAEGQFFQSGECAGWREGIRRAENVRRRGVYAVVDAETVSRSWSGIGARRSLLFHADPECPCAAGKERWDGQAYAVNSARPDHQPWNVWTIADVLTGRVPCADAPFCPRCVMLEAEAARELVTA